MPILAKLKEFLRTQGVHMAYDDFARLVQPKVAFFRTGIRPAA